ncbi:MAG: corrinoid protein, partial [Anaerolineae bacterium]
PAVSNKELFEQMIQSIIDGEDEEAARLAQEAVSRGISPLEAINEGFSKGILEVGERFAKGIFFLPEIVMGAEAMKAAISVLEPELLRRKEERQSLGLAVAGTVAGDIHDIGKNLVCTLLTASGFDVINLGVDVSTDTFVKEVRERQPDLLLLSALITTTMVNQRSVIQALKEAGIRDKVKVMVGGAPVTSSWAEEIEADGYAENATEAVKVAKWLVGTEV